MRVVIISGGTAPSNELLKREISFSDYIICADRGAECLYKNNITPNYLLGDFDSIDKSILEYYKNQKKCEIVTFSKDKDYTDTSIALSKAIELGATNITFLGATGTRIDHMLGNIGLLKKCVESNIEGCIKDNNNEIYLINKPKVIKDRGFKYLSIQSYCNSVKGLFIKGSKYDLQNYDLVIGDSLTVSNEFMGSNIELDFKDGMMLVIYSID